MSDDPKDPALAEPGQMSEESLRAKLKRARAAATIEEVEPRAADAPPTSPAGDEGSEGSTDGGSPDGGSAGGGAGGSGTGGDGGDGDDEGEGSGAVSLDELDLRDALRGALRPPTGTVAPKLLSSVQRKIRIRSRGKFYGDGWSTAEKPRSTYLVTSILMLVVVALVFLALIPWSVVNLR